MRLAAVLALFAFGGWDAWVPQALAVIAIVWVASRARRAGFDSRWCQVVLCREPQTGSGVEYPRPRNTVAFCGGGRARGLVPAVIVGLVLVGACSSGEADEPLATCSRLTKAGRFVSVMPVAGGVTQYWWAPQYSQVTTSEGAFVIYGLASGMRGARVRVTRARGATSDVGCLCVVGWSYCATLAGRWP